MGDPDDESLEARVERLEEQVSKTMPSRRQLLAGAGTLGVGALLGGGAGSAAAADGTQDTSDGTVRGNGGGVDIRLDELRDPGGDEVFDVDDTGAINAAVSGREFRFDSINTGNLSTTDAGVLVISGGKLIDIVKESDHADIFDAFNQAKADNGTTEVEYIIPAGDYGTVSTTMDLTRPTDGSEDNGAWSVIMRGVRMTLAQGGNPAVENIGGNGGLVVDANGSVFKGSSSSPPSVGVLLARHDDDTTASLESWDGADIIGDFQHATWYNIGGEVANVAPKTLRNGHNSARSVLTNIARNVDNVDGVHATPYPASGTNVTRNTYDHISFIAASGPDVSVFLGPSANTEFFTSYFSGDGDSFVRFDASQNSVIGPIRLENPRFEPFGGSQPTNVFDALAPSSGINSISRFVLRDADIATTHTDMADIPKGIVPRDWNIGYDGKGEAPNVTNSVRVRDDSGNLMRQMDVDVQKYGAIVATNTCGLTDSRIYGDADNIPIAESDNVYCFDIGGSLMTWCSNGEKSFEWNWATGDMAMRGQLTEQASDSDFS